MKEQKKDKNTMQRTQTPKKHARITHDNIRFRAYEIYIARNSEPGCDLEDWLKAEMELLKL